jgi:hypothetical protein
VVVKIQEDTEDDKRNNDEALKQVAYQYQTQGNGHQQYPTDLYGGKFAIVPVNVVQHGGCTLIVLVAGKYEARFFQLMSVKSSALFKFQGFYKTIDSEAKGAVYVFLYIFGGINSYNGYFILCKRIFFHNKMFNANGIGKCNARCN